MSGETLEITQFVILSFVAVCLVWEVWSLFRRRK